MFLKTTLQKMVSMLSTNWSRRCIFFFFPVTSVKKKRMRILLLNYCLYKHCHIWAIMSPPELHQQLISVIFQPLPPTIYHRQRSNNTFRSSTPSSFGQEEYRSVWRQFPHLVHNFRLHFLKVLLFSYWKKLCEFQILIKTFWVCFKVLEVIKQVFLVFFCNFEFNGHKVVDFLIWIRTIQIWIIR